MALTVGSSFSTCSICALRKQLLEVGDELDVFFVRWFPRHGMSYLCGSWKEVDDTQAVLLERSDQLVAEGGYSVLTLER